MGLTEIDRSLAVGAAQDGRPGRRPLDVIGLAIVVHALSAWHKEYLEGGGYGFIIGEGALNYGPELIGDIYYKVQLSEAVAVSAICHPIVNPAYNRDLGPVQVFSARLHVTSDNIHVIAVSSQRASLRILGGVRLQLAPG